MNISNNKIVRRALALVTAVGLTVFWLLLLLFSGYHPIQDLAANAHSGAFNMFVFVAVCVMYTTLVVLTLVFYGRMLVRHWRDEPVLDAGARESTAGALTE